MRLASIVENLTKVRLELLELAEKGQAIGDVVEAVNTRIEVSKSAGSFPGTGESDRAGELRDRQRPTAGIS